MNFWGKRITANSSELARKCSSRKTFLSFSFLWIYLLSRDTEYNIFWVSLRFETHLASREFSHEELPTWRVYFLF